MVYRAYVYFEFIKFNFFLFIKLLIYSRVVCLKILYKRGDQERLTAYNEKKRKKIKWVCFILD